MRKFAAWNRPTRTFRSTVIRCRRNMPSRCGATTNGWGAANERILTCLGVAHVELGCACAGRLGCGCARVELLAHERHADRQADLRHVENLRVGGTRTLPRRAA